MTASTSTAIVPVTYKSLVGEYVLLPDGTVRKPFSAEDWLFWTELGRRGAYTLRFTRGPFGSMVTTDFLGFDEDLARITILKGEPHPEPVGYRPLVFETVVLGGEYHGFGAKYRDRERALVEHGLIVATIRGEGGHACPECGRTFALSRWADSCHGHEGPGRVGPLACARASASSSPGVAGSDQG